MQYTVREHKADQKAYRKCCFYMWVQKSVTGVGKTGKQLNFWFCLVSSQDFPVCLIALVITKTGLAVFNMVVNRQLAVFGQLWSPHGIPSGLCVTSQWPREDLWKDVARLLWGEMIWNPCWGGEGHIRALQSNYGTYQPELHVEAWNAIFH